MPTLDPGAPNSLLRRVEAYEDALSFYAKGGCWRAQRVLKEHCPEYDGPEDYLKPSAEEHDPEGPR